MYYEFLVKIPENTGKISKNKRGNTTYIEYTYGRKYVPEKKYNVPQRTTIGKQSADSPEMMYPNPSFEKYFPDIVLASVKRTDVPGNGDTCHHHPVVKHIAHLAMNHSHTEDAYRWTQLGVKLFALCIKEQIL